MRVVIQRVTRGSVAWDGNVETIGRGFVLLVGAGPDDDESTVRRMADKVAELRVFADGAGKMNLSLEEVRGSALVVSQFTVYADMSRGRRPSFIRAGDPERAEALYLAFASRLRDRGIETKTGSFGAHMTVSLDNDGPVTLVISSDEWNTRV